MFCVCFRQDICRDVPSSMQEDTDRDNKADNCDIDDDSDGRYDWLVWGDAC